MSSGWRPDQSEADEGQRAADQEHGGGAHEQSDADRGPSGAAASFFPGNVAAMDAAIDPANDPATDRADDGPNDATGGPPDAADAREPTSESYSPPRTGDPVVDAALAGAAAVQGAEPAEQLEVYVGTHRALQDRLADSGA